MMIMQPAFVTPDLIRNALTEIDKKNDLPALPLLR